MADAGAGGTVGVGRPTVIHITAAEAPIIDTDAALSNTVFNVP